jgi:hypothetical protein
LVHVQLKKKKKETNDLKSLNSTESFLPVEVAILPLLEISSAKPEETVMVSPEVIAL